MDTGPKSDRISAGYLADNRFWVRSCPWNHLVFIIALRTKMADIRRIFGWVLEALSYTHIFVEQKSEYSLSDMSDISLVSEVSSLTPCTYYNCFAEVTILYIHEIVTQIDGQ